jgi:hypothetical protein
MAPTEMNALAMIDKNNVVRRSFIFISKEVCGLQWDEHTYPPRYSRRYKILLNSRFGRSARHALSDVLSRPWSALCKPRLMQERQRLPTSAANKTAP